MAVVDHVLIDFDGAGAEPALDVFRIDSYTGSALLRADPGQSAKTPFSGQHITLYGQSASSHAFHSAGTSVLGAIYAPRCHAVMRVRARVTDVSVFGAVTFMTAETVAAPENFIRLYHSQDFPNEGAGTGYATGLLFLEAVPDGGVVLAFILDQGRMQNGLCEISASVTAADGAYVPGMPLDAFSVRYGDQSTDPYDIAMWHPLFTTTQFFDGTGLISQTSADVPASWSPHIRFSHTVPDAPVGETGQPPITATLGVYAATGQPPITATLDVVDFAIGQPAITATLGVYAATGQPPITATLDVAASVVDAAVTSWSETVTIAATPMRVTGAITITHRAGTARIATFQIVPPAGPLAPATLIGQTVMIRLTHTALGAPRTDTLFVGVVETPALDLASGALTITATDGRAARINALSRAEIDALTPGARWSRMAYESTREGADYATDRLGTVAAWLDLGQTSDWRYHGWATGPVYRTIALPEDMSESLEMAPRSSMVNQIVLELGYRYARLAQRQMRHAWDMDAGPYTPEGALIPDFPALYFYYSVPAASQIEDAATASGWRVDAKNITPANLPYHIPGFAIAADVTLSRRYYQTITETYTITVEAPASVAAAGLLMRTECYSAACDYDAAAWEADPVLPPLLAVVGQTGEASTPGALGDLDRAEWARAVETWIARAAAQILDSHRHTWRATLPLDPWLDTGHTVSIDTARVSLTGVVEEIAQTLDTTSGRAAVAISVRTSGIDPAAAPVSESAVVAPPPPGWPAPDLAGLESQGWTQFAYAIAGVYPSPSESLDGYTVYAPDAGYDGTYRITAPAIPDADHQPLELLSSATYSIAIPEDGLTITL